ncbi:MAG: hypothetical protein RR957_00230 [Oscillospiraceae bacterium]
MEIYDELYDEILAGKVKVRKLTPKEAECVRLMKIEIYKTIEKTRQILEEVGIEVPEYYAELRKMIDVINCMEK